MPALYKKDLVSWETEATLPPIPPSPAYSNYVLIAFFDDLIMVTASFSDARSAFLIARLQNQVTQGRRAESGFKKEAWAEVTTEFNKNFRTDFTREQLKNHFQTLKTSYGIVWKLLDRSGFGWDDTSKTVTAEPREWNAYIAVRLILPSFSEWHVPDLESCVSPFFCLNSSHCWQQKFPKAKTFRDRQFIHYNALHELIGSTKARGPALQSVPTTS